LNAATRNRLTPATARRNRLKQQRAPKQDCRPNGRKDSSAAKAEDAKFAHLWDSSSTQPKMPSRGDSVEHRRHCRKTVNPGEMRISQLAPSNGHAARAKLESGPVEAAREQRRFGATRRFSLARPEGESAPGKLGKLDPLAPEDAGSGVTRRLVIGDTE